MEANPGIMNHYWYVGEYHFRITKLRELYQKPFTGKILTCGVGDMCMLGSGDGRSAAVPRHVKTLSMLNIVWISCGSTYTDIITGMAVSIHLVESMEVPWGARRRVLRQLAQVREFHPSPLARH